MLPSFANGDGDGILESLFFVSSPCLGFLYLDVLIGTTLRQYGDFQIHAFGAFMERMTQTDTPSSSWISLQFYCVLRNARPLRLLASSNEWSSDWTTWCVFAIFQTLCLFLMAFAQGVDTHAGGLPYR